MIVSTCVWRSESLACVVGLEATLSFRLWACVVLTEMTAECDFMVHLQPHSSGQPHKGRREWYRWASEDAVPLCTPDSYRNSEPLPQRDRPPPREPEAATGRFVRGKGAALKSGMYSRLVRRGEYHGRWMLQQERYELRRQLGSGNNDIVLGQLVDAYVEVGAASTWLGEDLKNKGSLTGKGYTRATLNAYGGCVDRQVGIALAWCRSQVA